MPIPRMHLFELEDQTRFPTRVRDYATDYLHFIESRCALHRPVVRPLSEALRESGATRIIDLCSGGGGPIPAVLAALRQDGLKATLLLTDRYPNLAAFQRISADGEGAIEFYAAPVDAANVPQDIAGFRTMFNAFHHFAPRDAVAVLRCAVRAGQPIGIFEIPERAVRTILPVALLTPLLVALVTPFIRPISWQRLVLTYLLPLVPLTCWWDGIVSMLRAYTPAELRGLADEVGRIPISGALDRRLSSPRPECSHI